MSGNVIFTWPSSGNSSSYDVYITRPTTGNHARVDVPQYIVKDAIFYDSIGILIYYLSSALPEIRSTYNGIWSLFLLLIVNS